jgi:hypothetical protein
MAAPDMAASGMAACHACGDWRGAHALLATAARRRRALEADSYEQGMLLFEVLF